MPQVSQVRSSQKRKSTYDLWFWLKLLVTGLVISYLYHVFSTYNKDLSSILTTYTTLKEPEQRLWLFVALLLVPANWALESRKWQLLANKALQLRFSEAFKSTLIGLAVGVAVPAQLGDTLGRVGSLASDNRIRAVGAAVVSNGIQFYVSLLAACLGWWFMAPVLLMLTPLKWSVLGFGIALLSLGFILALLRKRLHPQRKPLRYLGKYAESLDVIRLYRGRELLTALCLGIARYALFSCQYVLVLYQFSLGLSLSELLGGVVFVLSVKTFLPALTVFSDLGVREVSAVYYFTKLGATPDKIMAATLLIWCINILLPLVVGAWFLWQKKWRFN
ncbi:lysylphosphatidylglycerol synthase domain-containing protein [Arundinibacter roseus]|uniref:UPF0104 family protein n=1 Tax=Arundinibacter roseus TaxID=2070510 RepID=A0A4V2X9M7_9BACT|nr:lysylphosphatidylglycerol synthase domain-containing protein [Arundinibacter roseus]TDB64445.1 UPF0104 family protein [Arundinibacter roseus]